MDVTDIVDYNIALVNPYHPSNSFFCLKHDDPTVGFQFDASAFPGFSFPPANAPSAAAETIERSEPSGVEDIALRLRLGSHLAFYLRHELDRQKDYTSTIGISTNKLLSKLVGNVNKPREQTLLLPPYRPNQNGESNVHDFVDQHDIGAIPGIGFKTAFKLRSHVLGRPAQFDQGLVYGSTLESISVRDVRLSDRMGSNLLQKILNGPGVPKDLPERVWGLINGIDDMEVAYARGVPHQISIEDSYLKLDEMQAVLDRLQSLSVSLIKRLRVDLTTRSKGLNGEGHDVLGALGEAPQRRWMAHPKVLRLSTRCRPPRDADGTRQRSFARTSLSAGLPSFVFDLAANVEDLARRLVEETVRPLFTRLHPQQSGWDLSLINLCAANIILAASDGKDAAGRDIADMFRKSSTHEISRATIDQQAVTGAERHDLEHETEQQNWRASNQDTAYMGSEDGLLLSQKSQDDDGAEDGGPLGERCDVCGSLIPIFALLAHERFHAIED